MQKQLHDYILLVVLEAARSNKARMKPLLNAHNPKQTARNEFDRRMAKGMSRVSTSDPYEITMLM